MFSTITTALLASAALVGAMPARRDGSISVTPHDQYSSSVGVPGCKIDTNRVAYWPMSVDCDNICVKVTNGDRSLHLLRIDTSGGAYDISYDAWNELAFGASAKNEPHMGGGVSMTWENVDNEECSDLLDDGKLPLSAANSMNFWASCQGDSWVGRNSKLVNIMDSACNYGADEECTVDLAVSNQPSCPSGLGVNTELKGQDVINIAYGTGEEKVAQ